MQPNHCNTYTDGYWHAMRYLGVLDKKEFIYDTTKQSFNDV